MHDETPLFTAAKYGYKAVVKLLIGGGAELEAKDKYGETPLIWAAMSGKKEIVKLLLQYGTGTRE